MLQALGWEQASQHGLGQPFGKAPTCLAPGKSHEDKVQHWKAAGKGKGEARSWDFSRRRSSSVT